MSYRHTTVTVTCYTVKPFVFSYFPASGGSHSLWRGACYVASELFTAGKLSSSDATTEASFREKGVRVVAQGDACDLMGINAN
jgi:hypothetical protein